MSCQCAAGSNISSFYSLCARHRLPAKQGYLDNPPREPSPPSQYEVRAALRERPTAHLTLLQLISEMTANARLALTGAGEEESVCVLFYQHVWIKLNLLLPAPLSWSAEPRSWLQTLPGCCLSVSSQPATNHQRPAVSAHAVTFSLTHSGDTKNVTFANTHMASQSSTLFLSPYSLSHTCFPRAG